jgi:hypothetical protein
MIFKVTLVFWDSMPYRVLKCYFCLRGNCFLKLEVIKNLRFLGLVSCSTSTIEAALSSEKW